MDSSRLIIPFSEVVLTLEKQYRSMQKHGTYCFRETLGDKHVDYLLVAANIWVKWVKLITCTVAMILLFSEHLRLDKEVTVVHHETL